MTDGLISVSGLSAAQLEQIRHLAEQCNRAEGLVMKLNWSRLHNRPTDEVNDFLYYTNDQLAGFLGLYIFNNREAEVSAMVAPQQRRQGIFSRLLANARHEVQQRNIPSLLFICEQSSVDGQAAIRATGAIYEFSEYRMDLPLKASLPVVPVSPVQLKAATPTDIPVMAAMDEICFNVPTAVSAAEMAKNDSKQAYLLLLDEKVIGKIHILHQLELTLIAGFCIQPEYRGQGHGSAILARVVADLLAQGHCHIALEVETKNDRALNIYRRCGFAVTTAYDYYRLPTNG